MLKCIECGHEYFNGALFCQECGFSLVGTNSDRPEYHKPKPSNNGDPIREIFNKQSLTMDEDGKVHLVFLISHSGRRVKINLNDTILVGRSDKRQSFEPELDLSDDHGLDHGVSRNHAMVKLGNEGLLLIDLDSTNGTELNDRKLKPNDPYPLGNGDIIKFGRLSVRVLIED